MKAISIRQPWAWLIVNGHKDVENRDWRTNERGRILIHAARTMTPEEYADCDGVLEALCGEIGIKIMLPPMAELKRGGIVGEAKLVDCVEASSSPWFFGRYGFVLKDAKVLPFQPCRGMPGFFECNNITEALPGW